MANLRTIDRAVSTHYRWDGGQLGRRRRLPECCKALAWKHSLLRSRLITLELLLLLSLLLLLLLPLLPLP